MEAGSEYAGPDIDRVRNVILQPKTGQYMLPVPLWTGRRRAEVISVRDVGKDGETPRTITVLDQIIHCRPQPERPRRHDQATFVLTLLHGGISTSWTLAIRHFPGVWSEPCSDNEANVGEARLLVDDTNIKCDCTLSGLVSSCYGPLEVTYVVLSNSVLAKVEIRLVPRGGENTNIRGSVIAHSKRFSKVMVLFDNDNDDDDYFINTETNIQLSRSLFAVSLIFPLCILVSLRLKTQSEEETLELTRRDAMVFYPETCATHLKKRIFRTAEIQVKITWSNE